MPRASQPAAAAVREPARRLRVAGAFDVLVAGGGVAGCAAAVAAARAGARVALAEKENGLGGLATLGLVTVYLPICDGRGRQVMGGLAEEMLRRSVSDGHAPIPPGWKPGDDPALRLRHRFLVDFNPAHLLLDLEAWLLAEGVRLLYDTRVCAAVRRGGRLTHLVVENKSGRSALAAGAVVDATGDADVCAAAGERTVSLRTNGVAGWFYFRLGGDVRRRKFSRRFDPAGGRPPDVGPAFAGDRAGDVAAQQVATRAGIRAELDALRAAHPGARVDPLLVPLLPGFRMTRRLAGTTPLRGSDAHRWRPDAVALSGHWSRSGPVYAIALRHLAGRKNANLFAAGRCIAASGEGWNVARAIPACVASGQAAGVAAAMAAAGRAIDVDDLQDGLRRQGVRLDPDLLAPAPVPPPAAAPAPPASGH